MLPIVLMKLKIVGLSVYKHGEVRLADVPWGAGKPINLLTHAVGGGKIVNMIPHDSQQPISKL